MDELNSTKHPQEDAYDVFTRRLDQTTEERILGDFAGEYFIETYKYWGGKMYCAPCEEGDWPGAVMTGSREEIISKEEGPANTDLLISLCRKNVIVRSVYFWAKKYIHIPYIKYGVTPVVNFMYTWSRIKRAIMTDDEFLESDDDEDC